MESAHQLATAAAQAISQHDYAQAEGLYRQVIEMIEIDPSPKNPNELDVAHCFNSLAYALEKQNKIEEAEEIKHRAVEITAKELNDIDGFDR